MRSCALTTVAGGSLPPQRDSRIDTRRPCRCSPDDDQDAIDNVVSSDYNDYMRTIGVRELKAELSRVLRDVKNGEAFLVTDRGRVVAELRRPDGGILTESRVERALSRLAASGVLRVAERRMVSYPASPLHMPDGSARDLLNADRDEA